MAFFYATHATCFSKVLNTKLDLFFNGFLSTGFENKVPPRKKRTVIGIGFRFDTGMMDTVHMGGN